MSETFQFAMVLVVVLCLISVGFAIAAHHEIEKARSDILNRTFGE